MVKTRYPGTRRSPRPDFLGPGSRTAPFYQAPVPDADTHGALRTRNPFRRTPPRGPTFGRRAPGIPLPVPGGAGLTRFLPWLGGAVFLYEWFTAPESYSFAEGWTMYHDCGGRPLDEVSFLPNGNGVVFNCLGGQATPGSPLGTPVPDGWDTAILGRTTGATHVNIQWWYRGEADPPIPSPVWHPAITAPMPSAAPSWLPSLNPGLQPIGQPGTFAPPIPFRALPHVTPNPWRETANSVDFARGTATVPERAVRVEVEPAVNSNIPVTTITEVDAPPREPPKRNEKEKKLKIKRSGVTMLLGAITEGVDLINAFFWALPEEARRGVTTQNGRMRALWEHFSEIDVIQAVQNAMMQELQDTAIGRASRLAGGRLRGPWDDPTYAGSDEAQDQLRFTDRVGLTRGAYEALSPEERRAYNRSRREVRRLIRAHKRGGSNRRNTGPRRQAKRRDGSTYYYSA